MSKWKHYKRQLLPRLAPLIYGISRFIGITTKLESEGFEPYSSNDRAYIFAGWHGTTMLAANFFKGRGYWTLISNSRDGTMQNVIFTKYGFKTIRGSTGKEGLKAIVEAIKVLKNGESMAFTPDGPRGPSGIVQPGIMLMAQKSGAMIVPVGISAKRRILAKSWDKYIIPYPFNRGVLIFGDAVRVPATASEEDKEHLRLQVEAAIHRCQAEADRRMGHS